MFYNDSILTKKGPLANIWIAANWGDKRLTRNQVTHTDIPNSIAEIIHQSFYDVEDDDIRAIWVDRKAGFDMRPYPERDYACVYCLGIKTSAVKFY